VHFKFNEAVGQILRWRPDSDICLAPLPLECSFDVSDTAIEPPATKGNKAVVLVEGLSALIDGIEDDRTCTEVTRSS
jgi:hypothetical protein